MDKKTQKNIGAKKKVKEVPTIKPITNRQIEKQSPNKRYNDGSAQISSSLNSAKKCKLSNSSKKLNIVQKKMKNCDSTKKTKKEDLPVQTKEKDRKKFPSHLFQNQKPLQKKSSLLHKKTKKQTEQNGYRGPLRPISPINDMNLEQNEWTNDTESEGSNDLSVNSTQVYDMDSQSDTTWNTVDCDIESESQISSGTPVDDDDFSSSEFDYSSTDSQCDDYESDSENDNFQNFSDGYSDSTYQLPDNVPEDIYVAKGAAVKHDLSESNEIGFDSDDSCPQIIEITNKDKQQQIQKAITWNDEMRTTVESAENADDSAESCPELVPIAKDDAMESDYDSDIWSDCIADKYFEHDVYQSKSKKFRMVPEIFKADKCNATDADIDILNATEPVLKQDVKGSPLERISNTNEGIPNYRVITVANKNQHNLDEERKVNKEVKTKIANTSKKGNDNSKFVDVTKETMERSLSPSNSLNKENDQSLSEDISYILDPDCSAEDDLYRRNESDQINNNIASPREKLSASGDSVRNKTQLRTLFFNAINSNQVIALLRDPLYIYGTLKLKLLAGGLDIFGYNPKPRELLEVFSPRGYASLKIEPSGKFATQTVNEIELSELAPNFLKSDIEQVKRNYDCKQDAIVILERNDDSKKVNMLRKYMIENLFPNMNLLQSDRPFYTSEFLLRCVLTPTADKPLLINPIWRSISMTNTSRVMVIGGKSVGKSSLVRFLSNNYLNKGSKVLLIDLDIGQPEMFIPQTVSATTLTAPLLGPGYLSVKEPDKAFLVGHINVVLQPQRYIQSIHALFSFCRKNCNYENIPWIVNTMGYNKGFGDEIIATICKFLNPSNIVQLESRNEINNFDVIMCRENVRSMQCDIIGDMTCDNTDYHPSHALTIMSSVTSCKKYQKDWEMKPRDIRLAMIISRLGTVLKGQAEWLTDIKPLCASTDDLKLINFGDEGLSTDDLLKSLSGNLVYLCKHNSSCLLECLGIGIVRGIDLQLKQIYLLPAIPLNLLEDVNCLAICGIPLPSSILINQGPKVKGVVSYIYNTIDRSASMHIKQLHNRPQHFLTGKFKSITN